jgi:hypothetical protein
MAIKLSPQPEHATYSALDTIIEHDAEIEARMLAQIPKPVSSLIGD